MSSSILQFLVEHLCPAIGALIANLLYSAPIISLRRALKIGSLGDLNTIPWAFMTGTCSGWVAYSYITKDPYVLIGSAPGLIVSLWLNFGAIKLQYDPEYDIQFNNDLEQDIVTSSTRVSTTKKAEVNRRKSSVLWETISLVGDEGKSKTDDRVEFPVSDPRDSLSTVNTTVNRRKSSVHWRKSTIVDEEVMAFSNAVISEEEEKDDPNEVFSSTAVISEEEEKDDAKEEDSHYLPKEEITPFSNSGRFQSFIMSITQTENGRRQIDSELKASIMLSANSEIGLTGGFHEHDLDEIKASSAITQHEKVTLTVATFWLVFLSTISLLPISIEMKKLLVGLVTNVNTVIFYGAPLSTIFTVLKTKNSASIHRLTLMFAIMNSFFWSAYGVAIKDVWISIPNGTGLIFSLLQVPLCIIFKQKSLIPNGSFISNRYMDS